MAGCPARKSRSTCNWPILRCRSSMTLCASSIAGAFAAREELTRALHQLLLPGADHRRMDPKLRRQLRQGLLTRQCRHRHARLELRVVLLPFYTHVSRLVGPVSP